MNKISLFFFRQTPEKLWQTIKPKLGIEYATESPLQIPRGSNYLDDVGKEWNQFSRLKKYRTVLYATRRIIHSVPKNFDWALLGDYNDYQRYAEETKWDNTIPPCDDLMLFQGLKDVTILTVEKSAVSSGALMYLYYQAREEI